MASVAIGRDRFLAAWGRCRGCGTKAYTVRELTLSPGQAFRCYKCFDDAQGEELKR